MNLQSYWEGVQHQSLFSLCRYYFVFIYFDFFQRMKLLCSHSGSVQIQKDLSLLFVLRLFVVVVGEIIAYVF